MTSLKTFLFSTRLTTPPPKNSLILTHVQFLFFIFLFLINKTSYLNGKGFSPEPLLECPKPCPVVGNYRKLRLWCSLNLDSCYYSPENKLNCWGRFSVSTPSKMNFKFCFLFKVYPSILWKQKLHVYVFLLR